MKTRTLVNTAVLAIVALALTASAFAQSLTREISLRGESARNYGTAIYTTVKTAHKFTVETVTPSLVNGAKLAVYIGPSTNVREPWGKLVGTIEVDDGQGAMILISAKAPEVRSGTTVSIVSHEETASGELIMKGTF